MSFNARFATGVNVLAAVVNAGSFVGAADALDMTQSGVSRAIARLEELVGVRLLDRTTRSISLTDEGRRLFEEITPLLASIEDAAASISGSRVMVRGRLRIHADPFFSRMILAPRIGEFLEQHPEVEVELLTRDQMGDLVAEGFNLAVRFGEPVNSSLIARKLLEVRILTVAAPSYLERCGVPEHPRELKNGRHQCIQYRDPASGRPFAWEFHRAGRVVRVATKGRVLVNEVGSMHAACVAGVGIAQVMSLGAEPLLGTGALVQLFSDWSEEKFPLHVFYPSRLHPPAKVRALLNFITSLEL